MTVPSLRFNEFSADWNSLHLGRITQTLTSGSRDWAQYYSKSGSKFIRMTNLSRKGIQLNLDDLRFVNIKSDSSDGQRTSLFHGDILVSITAELGKIGWVPPNFGEAYINQHTALLRIKRTEAESRFIAHLLSTSKQNKQLNRMNDSGAKAGLNLPTIKLINIHIPELAEQTKIANFLTAVDEKIAQLTRKCALLTQYKKGVMQQTFSQALRFKDEMGQNFPKWKTATLGGFASFFRGSSLSKADIEPNGKYECIHYGELFTSYNEVIHVVQSKTNKSDMFISAAGDILMPSSDVTPAGLAKASCVLKPGVALGGDINVIRIISSISPIFISYLLNFEKNKIIQLVSGTTVKHIYIKDIKSIELTLPSDIKEQTKIANFLITIDEKITNAKIQLAAMKQYKQGLLQQMFV